MGPKHRVASVEELSTDGSRVITEIDGQEIAVFRVDGEYHAIANYCVHQGGPLCEGELTGYATGGDDGWSWEYVDKEVITCPWHGWKFDVATGENIKDDRYVEPTYETAVEGGEVFVHR